MGQKYTGLIKDEVLDSIQELFFNIKLFNMEIGLGENRFQDGLAKALRFSGPGMPISALCIKSIWRELYFITTGEDYQKIESHLQVDRVAINSNTISIWVNDRTGCHLPIYTK